MTSSYFKYTTFVMGSISFSSLILISKWNTIKRLALHARQASRSPPCSQSLPWSSFTSFFYCLSNIFTSSSLHEGSVLLFLIIEMTYFFVWLSVFIFLWKKHYKVLMWRTAHIFNKGNIVVFVIKAWSTFFVWFARSKTVFT